jgi:drug/metabolite transporter (DMT)-like permease
MSSSATALAAPRHARGALILLLLGAAMLTFSGTLVKLSEVGPSATAFYRMTLALPFFIAWALVDRRTAPRRATRADYLLMLGAGLFLAADLIAWHWGLQLTSVANATLLGNSAPIFVVLAGWLLFGERFSRLFLLGTGLAVVGTIVLVGGNASFSLREVAGSGLGLLTGMFYAGYIILLTRLRARISTGAVLAGSTAVTSVCTLLAAVLSGERLLPVSAEGWLYLVLLATVCQAGAMGAVAWAMAHLPASFTAVTLLVAPVGATVNAWWILGEPIGPVQMIGGLLVLAGILLARRGTGTPAPAAP